MNEEHMKKLIMKNVVKAIITDKDKIRTRGHDFSSEISLCKRT